MAAAAAINQRRASMSGRDAAGAEPPLHLTANLREALRGTRFESDDEDGLRVRRADESPAVAEQDAGAIDADDLVVAREVPNGFIDDRELPLVRTVDANLRGRHEPRYVGEQVLDGRPGLGDDSHEPSGGVQGVVVPVERLREEHVPGH